MPTKKPTARKSKPSSKPTGEPPSKVQQTIYLRPEMRKKLRLRAVEDDCDLSTVVERALLAYFGE